MKVPPSSNSASACTASNSTPTTGASAPTSSPAIDIVMQPPCAAASSSSGLVFPSAWPMRVGSENPSSENAPEVAALIDPPPRATFPSHTMFAVRSMCGI